MIDHPFFSLWEGFFHSRETGCRSTIDQQLAAFLQAVRIGNGEDIDA